MLSLRKGEQIASFMIMMPQNLPVPSQNCMRYLKGIVGRLACAYMQSYGSSPRILCARSFFQSALMPRRPASRPT